MRPTPDWPTAVHAGDEAAGDPWKNFLLAPDLGYADYRRCGGDLSRAEYGPRVAALLRSMAAVRRGQPWESLVELATALRLLHPVLDERRLVPEHVDRPARVEELARVATDLCPDASGDAAELAFGPWSEGLRPAIPDERRALAVALAWQAASQRDGGRTPAERWSADRGAPPRADRARVRAVAQAPLGLWRVVGRPADDHVSVEDVVGLGPRWRPVGPVRLEAPGAAVGTAEDPAGLLARAVVAEGGWQLVSAVAIPRVPPRARVNAWVHMELLVARLGDRGLRREVFLARRGAALARAVHEWLWITA